ncbi:19466_t:CDS:2, partial [Racocetra fulgida]
YTEETGLDPWIKSESPQIEKDAGNHLSRDCIIKISKFPEEKDVFKYTDPEAKCPICKEVHTHRGIWGDWSCLRQYAIEHKMDPEKFSVITEAEKN